MRRLIWRCKSCGEIVLSYSNLRHDMNICDCGKSGVDYEEWYTRAFGSVEVLSTKEYDQETKRWKILT